ncbi:MAG: RluA family pseudouridine synthase [Eubacteriales bacterium]|nr:RluA family pseudouridine synthase [Eubacteriales bacterium]MDD3882756.1 RluA family pseudouridine synthase [Eubacteriales bacterium]MDD4512623.1 RluA family pseudouridine synthase [Eubacteriales bacterium]
MSETLSFACQAAARLDKAIAEETELTRSRALALIEGGAVSVDGVIVIKPSFQLKAGQSVSVAVPEPLPARAEAEDIPLTVLYQDEYMAVVVKPAGMVVHPAAGNPEHTLVNALLYHLGGLSGIGGEMRPGIVHRLDKDTSGLLLVAKDDKTHLLLSEMLKNRQIEKHYISVVYGRLAEESGVINKPIARDKHDRKKMAIDKDGRESVTEWKLIEELKGASLIDVHLITGRTHQIRVHMSSLSHPVLGDVIYGNVPSRKMASRLMLHSYSLSLLHPITGERMSFTAPYDSEFEKNLNKLRLKSE